MPLQLKASADAAFKIRSVSSSLVLSAQGDRVALLPESAGSNLWKYNPSNESVQNVETGLYISVDGKLTGSPAAWEVADKGNGTYQFKIPGTANAAALVGESVIATAASEVTGQVWKFERV